MKIATATAYLLLLFGASSTQAAIVIDFESAAGLPAGSFSDQGFTFTSTGANLNLFTAGGSQAMAIDSFDGGHFVTLVKDDGGAFAFDFIDVTSLSAGGPSSITFVGFNGTSEVTDVLPLSSIAGGTQNLVLSSKFDNVLSVRWNQTSPVHAFDNVQLNLAAVPEPSSIALLGIVGFATIPIIRRRR